LRVALSGFVVTYCAGTRRIVAICAVVRNRLSNQMDGPGVSVFAFRSPDTRLGWRAVCDDFRH
jgi:hypothetical protein